MATEATATKFHQNPDFCPLPHHQHQPQHELQKQPQNLHSVTAYDGLSHWQHMISGSVSGLAEHMAMFPVDTVKTHMQALGSCPIKSASVTHAFRSILHTEGTSGFYRGIAAMALGAGPAHAVHYSVYEFFKHHLSNYSPNSSLAHAASGAFAAVASDSVLTPMDMVKQRLQLGGTDAVYKGVWDCVKRVVREEGFGAFYASYRTTVLMNAPFMSVFFASYEAAKRGLMEISPDSVNDERWVVHATAGAAAGALAAAVTTPLDVVKTQLQCQGVCGCDRFKSGSIGDVFRVIVKKDGYRGLMRGWFPRMLFHAPAAAISWSTYEAAKAFFQDLNSKKTATSPE